MSARHQREDLALFGARLVPGVEILLDLRCGIFRLLRAADDVGSILSDLGVEVGLATAKDLIRQTDGPLALVPPRDEGGRQVSL